MLSEGQTAKKKTRLVHFKEGYRLVFSIIAVLQTSLLLMKSLNKTGTPIL